MAQTEIKPLLVLVVGMTDRIGGLETFLMSYCEPLFGRGIHFDFLCRFPVCSFQDRIEEMGGRVFHICRRSRNPVRFYREILTFFREHGQEYDVIWDNECMMNDLTPLQLAKRSGIPCRIYHSHNAANTAVGIKGKLQGMLHRLHRRYADRYVTDFWACSESAAQWGCPARVTKRKLYRIIRNAMNIDPFGYKPEVRRRVRQELDLGDAYVVGFVGQLTSAKNAGFLLDAFSIFLHSNPDAALVLAGDGVERTRLEEQAKRLELEERVHFLGACDRIPELLQALDLFAMPSKTEGLGIAAVEAQISGLDCILSDRFPLELCFRNNVVFLSIDNAQDWAKAMEKMRHHGHSRTDGRDDAQRAGYDIKTQLGLVETLWRAKNDSEISGVQISI